MLGGFPTYSAYGVARIVFKLVYWLAVLAVSLVLLVLIIRFFEARDESDVGDRSARPVLAA